MVGYLVDFKEKLENCLICTKCRYPLKEPYQNNCGHRFCESCIEEAVSEARCPATDCNDELCRDKFRKDKSAHMEMQELIVKCGHCAWEGALKTYENHLGDSCESVPVECTNDGCGVNLQRGKLEEHLADECPARVVTCAHCQHECTFRELQNHEAEICTKVPVKCPENCNHEQTFQKDQLESHLQECPLVRVQCVFKPSGCSFQGTRRERGLHLHNRVAEHLRMLQLHMEKLHESLALKCAVNRREITELQSERPKMDNLFGVVMEMQEQMQRERQEFNEFKGQFIKLQEENEKQKEEIRHLKEHHKETKGCPDKLEKIEKELREQRKLMAWLEEQNQKLEDELKRAQYRPSQEMRLKMMKDGTDFLEAREDEKKLSNGVASGIQETPEPVVLMQSAQCVLIGKDVTKALRELKGDSSQQRQTAAPLAQFTPGTKLTELSREDLVNNIHDLCGDDAAGMLGLIGMQDTTVNVRRLADVLIRSANEKATECIASAISETGQPGQNDERLLGVSGDESLFGAVGGCDGTPDETLDLGACSDHDSSWEKITIIERKLSGAEMETTSVSSTISVVSNAGKVSVTTTNEKPSQRPARGTGKEGMASYSSAVKHRPPMRSTSVTVNETVGPQLTPVPRPTMTKQRQRSQKVRGPCFKCFKYGHIKANCPLNMTA